MTTKPKGITLPFNPLFINVKDAPYNAVLDGVSDDTAALQAAINIATVSNIINNGISCTVFIPHGTAKISAELTINGAIAIVGDGAPMSISGSRIVQTLANASIFNVTGATNAAVFVSNLFLRDSTAAVNATVGLFKASGNVTSGNSFYFRNCWFATPQTYAINIDCASDDLQIIDCTFDVTALKFIKLGNAGVVLTNVAIEGNTFYAGFTNTGMIDCFAVTNLVCTGNRVYGGGFRIPYFFQATSAGIANNLVFTGNTFSDCNAVVITNYPVTFVGNGCKACGQMVAFGGGGTISGSNIKGNTYQGATSLGTSTAGIIDATGTGITNSDLSGNTLIGNVVGTTTIALNIPDSRSTNNKIANIVIGVTTKYVVSSQINNGIGLYTVTTSYTTAIASLAFAEFTVAAVGTVATDIVTINIIPPWTLQPGIVVTAYAGVDVVTIRYTNVTAGSITPTAQTHQVRVIRAEDK